MNCHYQLKTLFDFLFLMAFSHFKFTVPLLPPSPSNSQTSIEMPKCVCPFKCFETIYTQLLWFVLTFIHHCQKGSSEWNWIHCEKKSKLSFRVCNTQTNKIINYVLCRIVQRSVHLYRKCVLADNRLSNACSIFISRLFWFWDRFFVWLDGHTNRFRCSQAKSCRVNLSTFITVQ